MLTKDANGNVLNTFVADPALGSSFSSPGSYSVPDGAVAIMIQPSADVTVQPNATGPTMTYEAGVKAVIPIFQGNLATTGHPAVTTITFANTATVPIWVMK